MLKSDVQLIQRTLDGDDAAFAGLVDKYQKQVHALVWRKIGDFHFAEEITQDTFIKAHQQLRTLKKPQRFASWLYVIASNLCGTWLRNKNVRTQLQEHIDKSVDERATYSEHIVKENNHITVETQRNVVKKLLAKLGESERTVMTLHYFGEMSCSEIGAFLGVSTNTVKSRLRRAQQRLKKEEPIIREALDNFQISPNLTENIMCEISRTKPAAPFGSKPLVPWAVATSTLVVMLLMLGFGNNKYLTRFQKPYSFDATAEMTVDIIDAPVVANLEQKPDVRTEIGSANGLLQQNVPEEQPNNDVATLSEETRTEKTVKDYTKWELPEKAKVRLGKGRVNDIKFTPDGTQLVVGTEIGVWIYDANTGEEIALFTDVGDDNQRLNRSYINMLVSVTDANAIECLGLDGDKDLWDLEEDSLKSILPYLRRRNNVLQFKASNIKLDYSGLTINLPWHGRAGLWNPRDGENESIEAISLTKTHLGMRIAISPDERFLAAARERRFLAKGYKMLAIQVWDRTTGQRVFTVEETELNIKELVFSPDSKTLAYIDSSDIVRLWDIENNSLQFMFEPGVPLQAIAFSPDGSVLASGSTDGILRFWKVEERGKHSISERDFNIISKVRPHKWFIGHANNSKFVAINFSPDGKKVASANSDGTTRLWDADLGNQLFTFTQHSGSQTALAFRAINKSKMPDATNRTLTSIGLRNSHIFISVWDIDVGNRLSFDRIFNSDSEVAISPDGSLFVTKDNAVRLWDTQTKSVLSTLGSAEDQSFVPKVVFSPDVQRLAVSARKDNTVQIWDVPNRKTLCRLEGHTTYVYSLAFSPDNKIVITSGWTTKDVTIRLWDTMTGTLLASFPDQGAVAFAPDRNTFVGGTHIYTWNPETIQYDRTVRLEDVSKSYPPTALTFSPDGSIVVSGNRDGIVQLRDSTTGNKISEHVGHASWISELVFSEDGTTLATSGGDGTILVWDWEEVSKGSNGKD